ncbi:MAG TPA: hypothetical protein VFV95_17410 [Vicinamibacterales bacterium]|nr:hypothetical protein [Vicinamibacterales bacterium]
MAITRADGARELNPLPEALLQAGDEMVVSGRSRSVKALEVVVAA